MICLIVKLWFEIFKSATGLASKLPLLYVFVYPALGLYSLTNYDI